MAVLQTLHIRNLALVTELEVDFSPGFNVVTGETGAGKSLVLGAVQMLLGARVGPDVIRRGAAQCEVSAHLCVGPAAGVLPDAVGALLAAAGVAPCEDGQLVLRRVISASGSRAYVNGSAATAATLRDLGSLLVDVHGPHEHQSLLRPHCQLELLDAFAGLGEGRAGCAQAAARVTEAERELAAAEQETLSDEEAELLAFQVDEISRAGLEEGEEERLVAQHRRASNAQRLIRLADACRLGLAESETSLLDRLGHFVRLLQELESIDREHGAAFAERLGLLAEQVRDVATDLGSYVEGFEVDPAACAQTEERLELVLKLKRKYGPTYAAIAARLADQRCRLEQHRSRGTRLQQLAAALAVRRDEHLDACSQLSRGRQQAAGALAAGIVGKLHRLGFSHAGFELRVAPAPAGPRGADQVEFLFAPNAGEAMLPLRQCASSGEMARVMLAVKTVLTEADQVPVLIFDEVDANIGGRTAVTVAEELVAIARRHQVLSITHLPQIAAAGERHFLVSKHVQDERTTTTMSPLGQADREQEIARMLGAAAGSQVALTHAREMLAAAGIAAPVHRRPAGSRQTGAVPS
jgi:DNA repair protein RecN (Recombination protein N)